MMKFIEGTTLAQRLADGPLPPREAAAAAGADRPRRSTTPTAGAPAPRPEAVEHPDRPRGPAARRPTSAWPSGSTSRPSLTRERGDPRHARATWPPSRPPAAAARSARPPTSTASGAILYQMLTGRPPFQAASPLDTLLLVLEQDPVPPRAAEPDGRPRPGDDRLKCLQKPADLRYPTAAALADDLEAYLAGEPISARRAACGGRRPRLLRETHHAAVLENWGLLWMWHSLMILVLCLAHQRALQWRGVDVAAGPTCSIWTVGLGTWAAIFWALRRRGGPVTFVERQIAHVWAGSMVGCTLLFVDRDAARPAGADALAGAGACQRDGVPVKAGILSGEFYVQAAALFLTAGLMAVCAGSASRSSASSRRACFFVPGLQYHLRRVRGRQPVRLPGKSGNGRLILRACAAVASPGECRAFLSPRGPDRCSAPVAIRPRVTRAWPCASPKSSPSAGTTARPAIPWWVFAALTLDGDARHDDLWPDDGHARRPPRDLPRRPAAARRPPGLAWGVGPAVALHPEQPCRLAAPARAPRSWRPS